MAAWPRRPEPGGHCSRERPGGVPANRSVGGSYRAPARRDLAPAPTPPVAGPRRRPPSWPRQWCWPQGCAQGEGLRCWHALWCGCCRIPPARAKPPAPDPREASHAHHGMFRGRNRGGAGGVWLTEGLAGGNPIRRTVRGGSGHDQLSYSRLGCGNGDPPPPGNHRIGLRVARPIPAPAAARSPPRSPPRSRPAEWSRRRPRARRGRRSAGCADRRSGRAG